MEETGISGILLLQAVKANLVYEQQIRSQITFEFAGESIVSEAREKISEHVACRGIQTAIGFPAAEQEESLGDMALAGAAVAGKNHTLFAVDKVKLGQFHDLCLVDAFLEVKIKIGQQLALRKP